MWNGCFSCSLRSKRTQNELSSDDTNNRLYQHQTRRYREQIGQSPLDFKPDALRLTDFVRSDHQVLQLHLVDGDEWTGLIKVYQVLEKNGCLSEGQFIILNLKHLLEANQLMDFIVFMRSTLTQYLLLVTWGQSTLAWWSRRHNQRTL
jgi:hypothetical protein